MIEKHVFPQVQPNQEIRFVVGIALLLACCVTCVALAYKTMLRHENRDIYAFCRNNTRFYYTPKTTPFSTRSGESSICEVLVSGKCLVTFMALYVSDFLSRGHIL